MFDSVGWMEIVVLGVAGLFILGPERLPDAATWVVRSVRKMRDFASGARDQLRAEMGPEFDELRKPLQDLQQLRNLDPKRLVAQHLFDDDATGFLSGTSSGSSNGGNGSNGNNGVKPNGYTPPRIEPPTLAAGEKAPFDPDAT